MSGVSVCTCGIGGECPRDCAGARLQQLQCETEGHLILPGTPNRPASYCFRCGHEDQEDE